MSQGIPRRDLHRFDQSFYLGAAYDLYRHGVYSDGVFGKISGTQERPPPGMYVGPAYPALLALVMRLDPAFADATECMLVHLPTRDGAGNCRPYTSVIFHFHRAFWAGTVAIVWLVAATVFGGALGAWAAAAFALAAALINLNLTHWLMTESLSVFLSTLHGALLFYAVRMRRLSLAAAAGFVLGLLTLTRPAHLYLFWAYLGCAGLVAVAAGWKAAQSWAGPMLAFIAAFAATVLPWSVRNLIQVGTFGLSHNYGVGVLIERLSYNQMSLAEWSASFIYWIPRFGEKLAIGLFGAELFQRLDWNQPGSYYLEGVARRSQLEHAGSLDALLPQLIREELLGNIGQHLLVSVSLFWRGILVYGHLGLILLPILVALVLTAARRRDIALLLFILPAWLMAALHAVIAIGQPRYNLALIGGLSLAGAAAITTLARRFPQRLNRAERPRV
jgi:hypothetical protein